MFKPKNDYFVDDEKLFNLLTKIDKFQGDSKELIAYENSLEKINADDFLEAAIFFGTENDPSIIEAIGIIKSLNAGK